MKQTYTITSHLANVLADVIKSSFLSGLRNYFSRKIPHDEKIPRDPFRMQLPESSAEVARTFREQLDSVALFRLSVIGPLISKDRLERGEKQRILSELAQRDYTIPGSIRRQIGIKTIEAWYYKWQKGGIDGLTPKIRMDNGKSQLPPITQEAILNAKRKNPQLSIRKIQELLESEGDVAEGVMTRSSVHRLLQNNNLSKRNNNANSIEKHFEVFNDFFNIASKHNLSKEDLLESYRWMINLIQYQYDVDFLEKELGGSITRLEIEQLLQHVHEDSMPVRNRAVIILAHLKKIPNYDIAHFLAITHAQVIRIVALFKASGMVSVFGPRKKRNVKCEDKNYKDAVFALLHSPPKDHDVNRTTWTLKTLCEVLKKNGSPIGEDTISKIIKNAGFRFRKAKIVLTSLDPEYKTKLHEITTILANLKPDEKFFSVDEYGPFSIKMQGGTSLVMPDNLRIVPQYQKSKGTLIVTAALELSENQITHFYSKGKNTDEMLKLLEILVAKYSTQSRIYFSWDAASWHASKKLYERLDEINSDTYRTTNKTPQVTLAPLPSSAQFLNVIESVFSGMSKAIIRNSDYQSVEECRTAIDRYFLERNAHFKSCPARAGKKIWGKELVPSEFSESSNCKDPLYSSR